MKRIRVLEEAADEAIAAADWYDQQKPGLGNEFSEAVDTAIDLIEEDIVPLSPVIWDAGSKIIKRLILKRFPYDIVVLEQGDESIVVAVAHQSRRPGYWNERVIP
jgi:hypothetical protein